MLSNKDSAMQPGIFESSTLSLILSWIFCIPIIIGIIAFIIQLFLKQEGVPWLFSAWLGICLLLFSPARYLIFQVAIGTSFMVQSLGAFISVFLLALYVPIIFGILYFIGIGLPLIPTMAILKNQERMTFMRGLAASIVLPVSCIICSYLFYWALPIAGKTVNWVNVKDVIKATNGPPALIYHYFTSPFTPTIVPGFFEDTPKKDIDFLRCHVAAVYLSEKKLGYFVKYQYPEIYEKAVGKVNKD
jgi:hypothetical protein